MKKEEIVHRAVCRYVKFQYPKVVFFSEPSGLRVSPGMANLLQELRSDSKLPDLFIAEPKGNNSGLFVEIKDCPETLFTKKGEIRNDKHIQEQKEMLERLTEKGYRAVFGPGFDACKIIIDEYMSPKIVYSHELIEKVTCRHFGIERQLLHCKTRKRVVVMPRQVVMTIAYQLTKECNEKVGLFFKLDHATVNHARKTVRNMIDTDKAYREIIQKILSDLNCPDLELN